MHTTYAFNRTISQSATLFGGLGALITGVFPPLGILLLIVGFCLQRRYTKARKAAMARGSARAQARADQTYILAAKSLRW